MQRLVEVIDRVEAPLRVLAHLGAGDFAREISLIDKKPRTASVFAESPSVVLVIDTRQFQQLLDTNLGLQKKMLLRVCERLRDADASLAALG
jgi:CRP/FNR family transcriptional regulator, cyclic AMP receptor protein